MGIERVAEELNNGQTKVKDLTKAERQNLIREGLLHPRVSARRCNEPTAAALVDNAVYAMEEALRETPQDFFLNAAYQALQIEYPQHFPSGKKDYIVSKLSELKLSY